MLLSNTRIACTSYRDTHVLTLFLGQLEIGSATLRHDNSVIEIESIGIDVNYRNHGYGKKFLNRIIRFCRIQGFSCLTIMILAEDQHVVQMCAEAGFRIRRQADSVCFMEMRL